MWIFSIFDKPSTNQLVYEKSTQENIMASPNEPADPIAKGVIPTAKQNLSDLLKWKQRVEVTNDYGESSCEWQTPEPLKNPISLFAQLRARDVSSME